MGSQSDWPTMRAAAETLDGARRRLTRRASSRRIARPTGCSPMPRPPPGAGSGAIIAGAGGAAHLPGMLAAKTRVPVLGVPVQSAALSGLDSLLSIVQMPKGVPVATFAIGAGRGGERRAVRGGAARGRRSRARRAARRLARGADRRGRRDAPRMAEPLRAGRLHRHPRRRPARADAGARRGAARAARPCVRAGGRPLRRAGGRAGGAGGLRRRGGAARLRAPASTW